MKTHTRKHKLLSALTSIVMLVPLPPSFSILTEKVFAEEPEPTVVEQTTPAQEPSPETTPVETIVPTPEVTPEITPEVTPDYKSREHAYTHAYDLLTTGNFV